MQLKEKLTTAEHLKWNNDPNRYPRNNRLHNCPKKIVNLIQELAQAEEIKTTSITEYELLKHKTKLKRQLAEDFLSEITIYPFDEAAAKEAAALFQVLQDAGRMINENDPAYRGHLSCQR